VKFQNQFKVSKNLLRYNLMKEENEEYLEAVNNNDLVEM
jgi:ribosomal protein S6